MKEQEHGYPSSFTAWFPLRLFLIMVNIPFFPRSRAPARSHECAFMHVRPTMSWSLSNPFMSEHPGEQANNDPYVYLSSSTSGEVMASSFPDAGLLVILRTRREGVTSTFTHSASHVFSCVVLVHRSMLPAETRVLI